MKGGGRGEDPVCPEKRAFSPEKKRGERSPCVLEALPVRRNKTPKIEELNLEG